MQRKAMEKLLEWKASPERKPLLIKGARQVGKTWLMREFGNKAYKNTLYLDFYNNERARRLFEGDLVPQRIIDDLQFVTGQTIGPGTLIIFDEIQECNRALNALKYFCEDAPEYHIIAAGSFLGIALHENDSFPVGKTDSITLYPMTFTEFLDAIGEERLNAVLDKNDPRLLSLISDELIKNLKYYFYTGGMPEVVLSFSKEKNFKKIRSIQKQIIADYQDDFSKHIDPGTGEKVLRLWNSIPGQLSREKKKFIYNDMKPGAKSRDFRSPLFWLSRCGLIYEVNRVSLPHYPLISYQEPEHFKLYLLDIGLLSAMCELDIDMYLEPDPAIFDHFHGALTEQYVLQELKTLENIPVFYWSREGSAKAELDFVIQQWNTIVPLEVKATKNLKAKSLKVFIDSYQPKIAIRSSLAEYDRGSIIIDLPLYAIGRLQNFGPSQG
ncbi:MAG: AAA family ATPase [Treponema sp.]|jgi:predicted AAA+ superfamily ATPase|nr:AAA family ATPase [Treponema sp.]